MQRFILRLTAREPLVLTDGSSETMAHQTLSYIPGRMLLGAMAGLWLEQNSPPRPDDHPEFRALFLDGSVSWGHAYPRVGAEPCLPVPSCWLKIKNQPGLPRAGDETAGELVNILAWSGEMADLRKKFNKPRLPKLKRLEAGFMHPTAFQQPDHLKQWTMHVALDRKKRKAAEGLLFGFSALAAGASFAADILVREEAAEAFKKLLALAKTFRVGHARSAGYGLVRVEDVREDASPPSRQTRAGRQILYFVSDYLPQTPWLGCEEALKEDLAPWLGQIKVERVFGSTLEIAGFNNLWRLPRETRTALAKGTVLELTADNPPSSPPPWPEALGGGREEGYGRFLLNPEFLNEDFPQAAIETAGGDRPETSPRAPAVSAPAAAILNLMRRRALVRETRRLAAESLTEPRLKSFIESAAKSSVSQSQRGNLRRLVSDRPPAEWLAEFKKALDKETVARKWRAGIAQDPFDEKREHLDAIMKKFLGPELMDKFMSSQPVIPGPTELEPRERADFETRFRRAFLLALLAAWEKAFRLKENK